MEEKYKKFCEYDWKNSLEWKDFFEHKCEIMPPFTGEKIERARKKFYKENIDHDFDTTYKPNSPQKNKEEKQKIPMFQQLISAIESFIWISYFLNMLMPKYILDSIFVSLSLRFLRFTGRKLFTKDYYKSKEMLYDPYFQLIIYACILKIEGKINFLNLFPFTIMALYSVCEYMCDNLRLLTFLKKYFKIIVDKKEKIFLYKDLSFVLISINILIASFFRWCSVILTFGYTLFLILLFNYNQNFNKSIQNLKLIPEKYRQKYRKNN